MMLRTLLLTFAFVGQVDSWIQVVLPKNVLARRPAPATRLASTTASESYAPTSLSQDAPASKEPFDYWRAW
jgi:hypothetical protein